MSMKDLNKTFQEIFKRDDMPRLFFAPGRINLIGEHTDYNGGYVFPAAISYGTYAAVAKRTDQSIRFYSMNFPSKGIIECKLNELSYDEAHGWANYPKGMIAYMNEQFPSISNGMDILYYGDIPNGAGLSSSASIEIVTGVLLDKLFSFQMDRIELVKLGQKVENEYIGVNCGIMDQFAVGMGRKNHALHLNAQTLEYTYAPVQLKQHSIIIIHTNKKRSLTSSKYNERRQECEKALTDLQTKLPIKNLCELTTDTFVENKYLINNKINAKRAEHVVYENERTKQALKKLQSNDIIEFGKLVNESHRSLKENYEVTGVELDTIVEAAWNHPGVLGARMTGAGFGGCAIAIVHHDEIESFKQNISEAYVSKIGYDPTFYIAKIGDGAKEITKEV